MRLDAGVPDLHCGVASRANSSAMVDHRSILLVIIIILVLHLLMMMENCQIVRVALSCNLHGISLISKRIFT